MKKGVLITFEDWNKARKNGHLGLQSGNNTLMIGVSKDNKYDSYADLNNELNGATLRGNIRDVYSSIEKDRTSDGNNYEYWLVIERDGKFYNMNHNETSFAIQGAPQTVENIIGNWE